MIVAYSAPVPRRSKWNSRCMSGLANRHAGATEERMDGDRWTRTRTWMPAVSSAVYSSTRPDAFRGKSPLVQNKIPVVIISWLAIRFCFFSVSFLLRVLFCFIYLYTTPALTVVVLCAVERARNETSSKTCADLSCRACAVLIDHTDRASSSSSRPWGFVCSAKKRKKRGRF